MATFPMIITCPGCQTRFQIKPASLGDAGRTVRCSSCGKRWFVEPFAEAPVHPLAADRTPDDVPAREAEPGPAPNASKSALSAWLLATLVVLLLAATLAGRNEIAARLPATVPLYQRLGLPIELPLGVEFRELSSLQRLDEGRKVLVVSGEITNISGQQRLLPPIRVALLDADRKELDFGLFDPPQADLGPGGLARFEVELGEPPPEASNFTVSFGELR
jgi:predicted Zn finger-like uncharacterized protein